MTVAEYLNDARAAHAARRAYQQAAERHQAQAIAYLQAGNSVIARYLARLSGLCQREASAQYDATRR